MEQDKTKALLKTEQTPKRSSERSSDSEPGSETLTELLSKGGRITKVTLPDGTVLPPRK